MARDRSTWPRMFVGALALLACDQNVSTPAVESPEPSQHLIVTRGDLEQVVLLTGELEAEASLELSVPRTDTWNVAVRWMAEDGAVVAKGDRLVEFDNTAILDKISDYELAVVTASSDLAKEQANSEVQVEEKGFEVEKQRVEVAKAELDTTVPHELISRRDLRKAELALAKAKVALGAAKDDLKAAVKGGKLEQKVKRIEYDKKVRRYESAGEQVDALVVKAPRDGVMVIGTHPWEGRKFQVGDNVWPGIAVAKLPNMSKMLVKATLSDVDDGRIAVGMQARCIIDAFPDRPIPGVLREVTPVAREAGHQSLRRFFSVVVELDETHEDIMRPGLSVKVEVMAGVEQDSLLAPRVGLDLSAEPPKALLLDGREVEIEIGPCNAQSCAIRSGLELGDVLRPAGGAS